MRTFHYQYCNAHNVNVLSDLSLVSLAQQFMAAHWTKKLRNRSISTGTDIPETVLSSFDYPTRYIYVNSSIPSKMRRTEKLLSERFVQANATRCIFTSLILTASRPTHFCCSFNDAIAIRIVDKLTRMRNFVTMKTDGKNPNYSVKKTALSAILSTTNPTRTVLTVTICAQKFTSRSNSIVQ